MEESVKELISRNKQLEKELNEIKTNLNTLQTQAGDAQEVKGRNEQKLLR